MAPKKDTKMIAKQETMKPSSRLMLAKNLATYVKQFQKFQEACDDIKSSIEDMKKYDQDTINDIDMQIQAKESTYQDLTENLENEYRGRMIKCDQELDEYQLQACDELLAKYQKRSVDISEWDSLCEQLRVAKEQLEVEIKNTMKTERSKYESAIASISKNLEYEKKYELAKSLAQIDQYQNEIKMLQSTIAMQKEEMQKQRELTEKVAMAASKSQISQNIGK